jgi:uncharacterized protein YabE (DUF348 family)
LTGIITYPRNPGLSVRPVLLLLALVIGFGAVLLGGLYFLTGSPVSLIIGGVRRDVRTHQATVGGLIAELALLVEPQDIVSPPAETPIQSGMTVAIDKAAPVVVEVDGQRRRVLTHSTQPRDILNQAGVVIGPHDTVYVDGTPLQPTTYAATPRDLRVVRAFAVHLNDNGSLSTIYTTARTVGEVLDEAHIRLYVADAVVPDADAPISENGTITLQRSVPVTIQMDGRRLASRTHGKTVGAALAEAGVALIGLDYTIPDETAPVIPDMLIQVIRVTEEDEVERTEIEFREILQTDTSIPPETQKVLQTGVKGMRERRVHVRLEDGVEVSRSAPIEVIVRLPRDQIVAVGATPSLIQPGTPEPTNVTSGSEAPAG